MYEAKCDGTCCHIWEAEAGGLPSEQGKPGPHSKSSAAIFKYGDCPPHPQQNNMKQQQKQKTLPNQTKRMKVVWKVLKN